LTFPLEELVKITPVKRERERERKKKKPGRERERKYL
jgi:hypothetical protein